MLDRATESVQGMPEPSTSGKGRTRGAPRPANRRGAGGNPLMLPTGRGRIAARSSTQAAARLWRNSFAGGPSRQVGGQPGARSWAPEEVAARQEDGQSRPARPAMRTAGNSNNDLAVARSAAEGWQAARADLAQSGARPALRNHRILSGGLALRVRGVQETKRNSAPRFASRGFDSRPVNLADAATECRHFTLHSR